VLGIEEELGSWFVKPAADCLAKWMISDLLKNKTGDTAIVLVNGTPKFHTAVT
jgi:hypothetical protein